MRRRFCVLVLACLGIGWLHAGSASAATTPPSQDPFYVPPPSLASYQPGAVIRSREVTPLGLTDTASTTAYELLYRTTGATGQPVATVTTLLLPALPPSGQRKLVSYQTAEDSLTTNCAPSYTIRGGNNGGTTQWAESGEIALLLDQGWDVAVPDYEGPQSEYGVGPPGGATLDGIRAVESFAPAALEGARTPVGMMGYSGGSIPTLWANSQARSYAPELNLVAAASGGNVPDPIENLVQVNGGVFAGVIVAVSVGIDRAYPQLDLDALLNARGRQLAAQDAVDGSGCAGGVTNAPFDTVGELSNYPTPQALEAVPRVRDVFANLDLIGRAAPEAPSFIYNEINDEIAIIGPVEQLVASDCARGAIIDFDRDPVGEHLTGAVAYVVPSLLYLEQRFAGDPPTDTCPASDRKPSTPAATHKRAKRHKRHTGHKRHRRTKRRKRHRRHRS
jgi:Secretory lipase